LAEFSLTGNGCGSWGEKRRHKTDLQVNFFLKIKKKNKGNGFKVTWKRGHQLLCVRTRGPVTKGTGKGSRLETERENDRKQSVQRKRCKRFQWGNQKKLQNARGWPSRAGVVMWYYGGVLVFSWETRNWVMIKKAWGGDGSIRLKRIRAPQSYWDLKLLGGGNRVMREGKKTKLYGYSFWGSVKGGWAKSARVRG